MHGISLHGAGTIDGVEFNGHRALNNVLHGAYVGNGINVAFNGGTFAGNDSGNTTTYDGINVAANIEKFAIRGVKAGQASGMPATQRYGIVVEPGTSNNYEIIGNDLQGNVTSGIYDGGTGTAKIVKDNLTGETVDVASVAAVTLPYSGDYFNITGTDNITSITASWVGRRVTLKFADILTFTDGSNLKIAGNFVTTADDTITLICDGTNWIELSRSVN